MDNNQNIRTDSASVPEIPASEMKMPEEKVAGMPTPAAPEPTRRLVSPLLIIMTLIVLALIGAVVFWGDQILNLLLPLETPAAVESETMLEENDSEAAATSTPSLEEEIASIEAEATSTDQEMSDIDNELNSIDAELEGSVQ